MLIIKFDYPLSITKKQMNEQNILAYMSIEAHKQTQNPPSLNGRFINFNSKFYKPIISLLGIIE